MRGCPHGNTSSACACACAVGLGFGSPIRAIIERDMHRRGWGKNLGNRGQSRPKIVNA